MSLQNNIVVLCVLFLASAERDGTVLLSRVLLCFADGTEIPFFGSYSEGRRRDAQHEIPASSSLLYLL